MKVSLLQKVVAKTQLTNRYIATEKTRDRLTTRTVEVFHDLNGIYPHWTGIKSLIRVKRVGTRKGQKYHEIAVYTSSLICTDQILDQCIHVFSGIKTSLLQSVWR